jgi:uncharacterized protein (TIGR00730 family)
MALQSIAVFCASKMGNNPLYAGQAAQLGTLIAQKGYTMIYGGGKNGLMGCVADACMAAGGLVRGIIPNGLLAREAQHSGISELTVVDDMHQRKRMMYELCDAAVILPGGFGTLDELFEMLTWNGLALHDKKVFLLNSGGFYKHLLQHLQLLQEEGLLYGKLQDEIRVLTLPEELWNYL